MMQLFHGGVPGLRAGDILAPGHERRSHPGCSWCAARARQAETGEAPALDPLAGHADRVYATPLRAYGRYHASLWGRGDLYYVEPVGELEASTEDTIETWMAPAFRIRAVADRAVLLTDGERARLYRLWGQADRQAASIRQERTGA